MKSKVRLLNFVVSFTLILLTVSAILVVLGIFNEWLRWDIFGPKLEAFFYGVFGSCMALAGFGVAMTVIIAVQEAVKDFKRFVQVRTNQEEVRDAARHAYLMRMLCVVLVMALLVGICAAVNQVVLTRRCKVFKRLTGEQVTNFQNRIVANVGLLSTPPTNNVSHDFYDLLKTMDNLDFIDRTTVYVPDAMETSVLWSFAICGNSYTNAGGFGRLYVAKDFEKAIQKAFKGNATDLEQINSRNEFVWYALLSDADKQPRAVLKIVGNSRQSFRDYSLGD
jgi:hypothetical protein